MSLDLLFVLLLPLSLVAGLLAARWLLTPRCAACHRPLLDPEGAFCSAACLAQGEGIPQPIGQEVAGPVYLPPEALPTLPRGLLGEGDRLTLAPVPTLPPEEGEEPDSGDRPEDDELGTPATARHKDSPERVADLRQLANHYAAAGDTLGAACHDHMASAMEARLAAAPAPARRALPPRLRGWPVWAASLPLFFGGCQRSPVLPPPSPISSPPSQEDCARFDREGGDQWLFRCQQAIWQEGCVIDNSPCAQGMCRLVAKMRGLTLEQLRALPRGWAYLPECDLPKARPASRGGEI